MKKEFIVVADVSVEVWRKPVKNVNLVVYRLDGRVRISVPSMTPDSRVRQLIAARLEWIKKQQNRFRSRPAKEVLQGIDGEKHLLWGKTYPLRVVPAGRRQGGHFDGESGLRLEVRPGVPPEKRLQLLYEFYRSELRRVVPGLLAVWQPRIGEEVSEWRIKKMKTRWGTCNIPKCRIWLNLELAKKPLQCLEYILVHEMVHLLEHRHNATFYGHMDRLLPQWREVDSLLKQDG